uniref:DNA-directed RNA polymerase RBP11-like dimerisation domain-containing protein n=1 Tax=Ditylum brightwellii TaxID=49249 RepID=A0A6U4ASV4_9STRA|mmetsp:Transcript_17650/g.26317  ORF Transcript_17650/g.26317 Transcript_17650/m.26317 type:complete len:170 (+) Transcript_17650:44-553(+)
MSVNEVKIKQAVVEFEVRGTGHPGSRTFAIGDEDHTIGNSLRHVMMQNADNVEFAGYSVPHPSEPVVHIRVQTAKPKRPRDGDSKSMDEDDGEDTRMTAIEALKDACQTLSDQCDFVLDQVEEAMPEVRADRLRIEQLNEADHYNEEGGEVDEGGEYEEGDEEVEDEGY